MPSVRERRIPDPDREELYQLAINRTTPSAPNPKARRADLRAMRDERPVNGRIANLDAVKPERSVT